MAMFLVLAAAVPKLSGAHGESYPMTPEVYRKKLAAQLERYRERVERHMVAQKFDDAKRAAVKARIAALEGAMRTRADKLAADGAISKADADELKQISKQQRAAIYKDYAIEADEKPKRE